MSTDQDGNDRPETEEITQPNGSEARAAPVRILIAKPGLDGHDRGAKVLVRALRDAGFEVVYTGLFQTPEMIASAALQEDVQVIGLSILSGAHMALFPRIMEELRGRGLDDVLVVAGGTIPKADIPRIKALGVAEVFGPGTRLATVVDYIRENAPRPSPLW
jgi:methylmalonyl-CoA mutase, C-terminal domain